MSGRGSAMKFAEFARTLALVSQGRPGHIVDTLIAERSTGIASHPLWPAVRPLVFTMLNYRRAVEYADAIANLSGFDSFDFLSNSLKLDMKVQHADRIPEKGGFLLVSNHPTGMADGVAVFNLLKTRRPDMMLFANRDAIRINPRFAEIVIPVEWREEHKSKHKTRETLLATNRAMDEGKVSILFPSGRIAYWENGRLNERPWKISAVSLARKYGLPILPVHMKARNSGLFYWLAKWSTELRDITLFHELLNKEGDRFEFTVGEMIQPEELAGDPIEITKALERHSVVSLAEDPNARFSPG